MRTLEYTWFCDRQIIIYDITKSIWWSDLISVSLQESTDEPFTDTVDCFH